MRNIICCLQDTMHYLGHIRFFNETYLNMLRTLKIIIIILKLFYMRMYVGMTVCVWTDGWSVQTLWLQYKAASGQSMIMMSISSN